MSAEDPLADNLPPPISFDKQGAILSRPGTRRARAACALCRWRKVRCDARDGKPCSNCNFENVQCALTPKQRRKKTKRLSKDAEKRSSPPLVEPADIVVPNASNAANTQSVLTEPKLASHLMNVGTGTFAVLPQSAAQEKKKVNNIHVSDQFPMPPDVNLSTQWHEFDPLYNFRGPSMYPSPLLRHESSLAVPKIPQLLLSIPDFLRPPPSTMSSEDVEYLHKKGALAVPDSELQNALLKSYFQFVHPCLPILELQSFEAGMQKLPGSEEVSLLLFQALMFAGSAWVDIKLLRRIGYLTRKAARKALYQKAKLIYDSDYEEDRLCLIQTLILFTLWWEGPNERRDAWHYMGVALSLSHTIGLHQNSSELNMEVGMQRFRRRLWWCCLMRDTIASFGLSRAPRIHDHDFDVEMLTSEDFEVYQSVQESPSSVSVPDPMRQRLLSTVCVEMAKLCRIISNILEVAYEENNAGQIGTLNFNQELDSTCATHPRRRKVDAGRLRLYEEKLREWHETVPKEALHQRPIPSTSNAFEQAQLAYRALLSMLYFTALMTLHRPRILNSSIISIPELELGSVVHDLPQAMVRYAAHEIIRITMDFYQADLARILPATCISCLLPAGISCIYDTRSHIENVRNDGIQGLEQCKQLLLEQSDGQFAAEWCINILQLVTTRIQSQGRARDQTAQNTAVKDSASQTQKEQSQNLLPGSDDSQGMPNGALSSSNGDGSALDLRLSIGHDTTTHQWSKVPDCRPPRGDSVPAIDLALNSFDSPLRSTTDNDFMMSGVQHDHSNVPSFSDLWLDFEAAAESAPNMHWAGDVPF